MKKLSALWLPVTVALLGVSACGGGPTNGTTGSGSTTGTSSGGSSGFSNPATGPYVASGEPNGSYTGNIVFESNSGLAVGNVYFQLLGSVGFATPPNPDVPDAGATILSGIELQVATPSIGASLVGTYLSTSPETCGGLTLSMPVSATCGDVNSLAAESACALGTGSGPPAQGSWTLDITSVSDPMTSDVGFTETVYLTHGTFTANLACGPSGDPCFQANCVPTATLSLTF